MDALSGGTLHGFLKHFGYWTQTLRMALWSLHLEPKRSLKGSAKCSKLVAKRRQGMKSGWCGGRAGGRTWPADSGLVAHYHTKEAGKCPEEASASPGTEPGPCRARSAASRLLGHTPSRAPATATTAAAANETLPAPRWVPSAPGHRGCLSLVENRIFPRCQVHMAKSPRRIDAELLRMFFLFGLSTLEFHIQGPGTRSPFLSCWQIPPNYQSRLWPFFWTSPHL